MIWEAVGIEHYETSYWIIENNYGVEYRDEEGDNLIFDTKQEAQDYIKTIKAKP